MSVDDGAVCSPEDTWQRNEPGGVAALSKEKLAGRNLKLDFDPEDKPEDLKLNPAHRAVFNVSAKDAKRLTEAAEIVIRLDGWQVRGANGTMGQLPDCAAEAQQPAQPPKPGAPEGQAALPFPSPPEPKPPEQK